MAAEAAVEAAAMVTMASEEATATAGEATAQEAAALQHVSSSD